MREADGLALSSRNAYLTTQERAIAPALHRVLVEVAAKAARSCAEPASAPAGRPRPAPLLPDPRLADAEPQLPALDAICEEAERALQAAGFAKVDYVAVREAETLKVVSARTDRPLRVLAAAWLGTTRLIDNVRREPAASAACSSWRIRAGCGSRRSRRGTARGSSRSDA